MPAALRRPGAVGALVAFALLVATSGRYGYHRDELYFLAAGRHLAWGYPDQPPLTPLLARLFDTGSLVVLRLPSSASAAAVVWLSGSMAARLGARRSGQWFAVASTALCGLVLGVGHLLSTATTLLVGSVVVSYLVLRLVQGGDRRLWLLVGVVGGITFQANALIGFLLLALALALRLRPGALVAGGIALLMGLPYLVWQARHGWPQLDVAADIAKGGSTSSVPRPLFLAFLLLQVGPWLAPVWITGLVRVLRDDLLRCFGVAFLLMATVFLALGGKPYYLSGLIPLFLAAGAQPVVDRLAPSGRAALLVLSAPTVVLTLSVLPVASAGWLLALDPDSGETIGWPSFAQQVSSVVPPGSVVVTQNYGEAGALQRYTSLPVFSGHNGYGAWGTPPGSVPAVLVDLDPTFCREDAITGRIRMPVDNDENGAVLRTCTPEAPWAVLWPRIRHNG